MDLNRLLSLRRYTLHNGFSSCHLYIVQSEEILDILVHKFKSWSGNRHSSCQLTLMNWVPLQLFLFFIDQQSLYISAMRVIFFDSIAFNLNAFYICLNGVFWCYTVTYTPPSYLLFKHVMLAFNAGLVFCRIFTDRVVCCNVLQMNFFDLPVPMRENQ